MIGVTSSFREHVVVVNGYTFMVELRVREEGTQRVTMADADFMAEYMLEQACDEVQSDPPEFMTTKPAIDTRGVLVEAARNIPEKTKRPAPAPGTRPK